MEIQYNLTGEPRKALVRAISEALGKDAVYQGAPTFAYTVDGYTISRDGTVTCPDSATREEVNQLMITLYRQGYTPNIAGENQVYVVEVPRSDFTEEAYGNLQKIIRSKAALLKKALGTDHLDIETTPELLRFPWFTLHDDLTGEVDAYTRLIDALCQMAKNQKRVTAKERDSGNDKFTMRLFLIRLGFIGDEYKAARKLLLRNLTGNSSWKSGHRPEQAVVSALPAPVATTEGGAPYAK